MASRPRPHAAARIEDYWHTRIEKTLRERGWVTEVIGHTGYASQERARVLGRVKLRQEGTPPIAAEAPQVPGAPRILASDTVRGWRMFATPPPAVDAPVTITLGDKVVEATTDRGGYIDVTIDGLDLQPGWASATIRSRDSEPVEAPIMVIGRDQRHVIVSDIDDTVIATMLPRALIAAWNTFVLHSNARRAVPGMAPLYRELTSVYDAPVIYLSTGAWNTQATLTTFLARHGYPLGPLLRTDWGPPNNGWFRSGQEHKRSTLRRLWQEFPEVKWILIGDDGQHDPKLYGDFAEDHPDNVEFITIRELTPAEQVLSHGLPVSNEEITPVERVNAKTPVYRAPDGYGLAQKLRSARERSEIPSA